MTALFVPWLSDPAWLAMDATARGLHTQLLLIAAAQRTVGMLPDDDAQWRRWLGLAPGRPVGVPPQGLDAVLQELLVAVPTPLPVPPKSKGKGKAKSVVIEEPVARPLPGLVVSALAQFVDGDLQAWAAAQQQHGAWQDHLWRARWRPMIEAAWHRIDAATVREYPHLAGHEGQWFHPMALGLAKGGAMAAIPEGRPDQVVTKISRTKGATKSKAKPATETLVGQRPLPALVLDARNDLINEAWLTTETPSESWRNYDFVLAAWRLPMSSTRRTMMWDLGVQLLADSPADERQARTFLGKLMKQHSEAEVARALSELSLRALPPVDAIPFLKAMLRRNEEGSEAEQKARAARAHVAL